MKNLDIEKSSSENIEVADVKEMLDTDVDHSLEARMPASLASLSEGELAAINKKATRKIDILLMPTLIFLYVLNFLDRNSEFLLFANVQCLQNGFRTRRGRRSLRVPLGSA